MAFKVGDRVVHPRHGLGQITRLAVKQFVEGQKRLFYEISFPGSTLWVPMNLSTSGIRKITVKSEIEKCRKLLMSPANPLNEDPRVRQAELNKRMNEGNFSVHCEVVRDVTAHGWTKPLGGMISSFLIAAQDVLYQEWATVEETSLEEASAEINALLEVGKRITTMG